MHNNEYNRIIRLRNYAIILFALSFILLFYGTVLVLNDNHKLIDPIEGVSVKDVNKTDSEATIDINSSGIPEQASPTINNDNVNPKTTESTQQNSEISTIDVENDNLRKHIQTIYGVAIKYGKETEGYTVGDLSTTPIYNSTTINAVLTKLETVLSHYPNGMFVEIKNGGIPLTIYLIEKYSQTGVTGVTDSNAYFANISIATSYPFEESFYHESYHYIERYMLDRKGLYFTTWNSYNPQGFNYGGTADSSLSFANNGGMETSYFVNNYAQTSEAEDRASTFEYMMSDNKAACLNKDQPVWRKAQLMAQAMDAALSTSSPNVVDYWERFL